MRRGHFHCGHLLLLHQKRTPRGNRTPQVARLGAEARLPGRLDADPAGTDRRQGEGVQGHDTRQPPLQDDVDQEEGYPLSR